MQTIKELSDVDIFKNAQDVSDRSDFYDRISTKAVLLNDDNKIAMVHFAYSDLYMLPGGKQDEGESLGDALVREVKEETGYNSKIVKELGLIIDYKDKIKQRNYCYCYLAKADGEQGEKSFTKNESKNGEPDLVWLSLDEAIKTQSLKLKVDDNDLYISSFIQAVQKTLLEDYKASLERK